MEKPAILTRGLLFFPLPQILPYETKGSQRIGKFFHPNPLCPSYLRSLKKQVQKDVFQSRGPGGQFLRHAIKNGCNEHGFNHGSFTVSSEKEMATHSNIPPWKIPGTEEPGGLPSMGSHRVGYDCSDVAAAAWLARTFIQRWSFLLFSLSI